MEIKFVKIITAASFYLTFYSSHAKFVTLPPTHASSLAPSTAPATRATSKFCVQSPVSASIFDQQFYDLK